MSFLRGRNTAKNGSTSVYLTRASAENRVATPRRFSRKACSARSHTVIATSPYCPFPSVTRHGIETISRRINAVTPSTPNRPGAKRRTDRMMNAGVAATFTRIQRIFAISKGVRANGTKSRTAEGIWVRPRCSGMM